MADWWKDGRTDGWMDGSDVALGALREVSDFLVVVGPLRVEVSLAVGPLVRVPSEEVALRLLERTNNERTTRNNNGASK